MKVLFAGQVAKDFLFPEAIEDAFIMDIASGRLAISDGASESYDSKTWARLITERAADLSNVCGETVSALVEEYKSQVNTDLLSWSKLAAYERGSFATLLSVENLCLQGTVVVLAIGDSLAALIDDDICVGTFPYHSSSEFSQRPDLISTKAALNAFIDAPDFLDKHRITWSTSKCSSPLLICMTDALAQWAIMQNERGNTAWSTLANIRQQDDLEALVARERYSQNMRIDDVTLITLSFDNQSHDELPQH